MRRAGLIRGVPAAAAALMAAGSAAAAPIVSIRPSEVDPGVKAFDEPSVVLDPGGASASAPLVVFLTGTGGRPQGALPFLQVIAAQGRRVVGLEYDDEPAVAQVCPQDPSPACSADFRRMRVDGEGPSRVVSNPAAESIRSRLVALLTALNARDPAAGWGGYLKDGGPDWSRLIVSGLSQGAGMAAFIAKAHAVARVVLFSSPWDWTGPDRTPAPWLSAPGATPPDRWWAERHARENTSPAIARAYAALAIPPDHIRVFDRDIPAQFAQVRARSPNPYHVITIRDPAYADDWRWMFGGADGR